MTNKNINQNGGGFFWNSLEETLQKAKEEKIKIDADVSADQSKKDDAQKAVDDAQKAVDDENAKKAADQSKKNDAQKAVDDAQKAVDDAQKPWYKFWGGRRRKSSKKSKKAKSMKGGRKRRNKSNKSKNTPLKI